MLDDLCTTGTRFLAAGDSYEKAVFVLLGLPMDLTSSFHRGSGEGPQAIRLASEGLEDYSPYQDYLLGGCSFYDAGNLDLPLGNLLGSLEAIEKACTLLVDDRKIPFFLGGEHLVTYPVVKVMARRYPRLAVVHLDAHGDLRQEYLGEKLSHATVMRRVCDLVGGDNLFQFGIRSGPREEFTFARLNTHFHPFEVLPGLREELQALTGRPVYLSLDIDVLDPAFAPGTGTPEPGGITPQQVIQALEMFSGLQVIGCDLVEVAPPCDPSGITPLLAAKLVREGLISLAQRFRPDKKTVSGERAGQTG
jgi:agmatinase